MDVWNEVAENFSKLSPNYWNYFGERLVEQSRIQRNDTILDLGTGRGAVLFPAVKRTGGKGCVIGIDLAENMVTMTNEEIKRNHWMNSKVVQMDMMKLDFQDAYFDVIVSGFSIAPILMNPEYMDSIIRILKDGGRLSFTIWGKQKDQQWLTDIVNEFIPPVPIKKESTSIDLTSPEYIRKILENAHLDEIRIAEEEKEVIYSDENQWWEEMNNNAVRSIIERIKEVGEDSFQRFQKQVNHALQLSRKEEGICLRMNAIYVFAKKAERPICNI